MSAAHDPDPRATERVIAWLEREAGGRVTTIHRQPRWRPVWFADVDRVGGRLELCVRGDRTDMQLIFPLDHEMRFQSLLHERGIPTAAVHGWIDDPCPEVGGRARPRGGRHRRADLRRRDAPPRVRAHERLAPGRDAPQDRRDAPGAASPARVGSSRARSAQALVVASRGDRAAPRRDPIASPV